MSSSPTVGQIVRQIIEQLSDGVSQLVLMVVVLQEQNADVPPSLPNAASAVMQTAVTLSRVASQLADTNYKNFPAIAKEIIDSATAVNDANGTMSKAIGVLTTSSDRKAGWAGLVDACRVMSGKTIKLLQIVYAAELKRLFATADSLLGDMDKLNTEDAKNNPQAFADTASDLASRAAQLAEYLRQRAKDEESPYMRSQLEERARQIDEKATQLIDAVNDLLQDPDNAEHAKRVNDLLKELNDLVANSARVVNENQTELPTVDEEALPSLAKVLSDREAERARRIAEEEQEERQSIPANFQLLDAYDPKAVQTHTEELEKQLQKLQGIEEHLKRNPNDPIAREELKKLLDELDKSAKSLHEGVTKDHSDAIRARAEEVRSHSDDLADAISRNDREQAAKASKLLANSARQLAEDLRTQAARTTDPELKKDLERAAEQIERDLGEVLRTAKDALDNPNDLAKKTAMQSAIENLKRDANRCVDIVDDQLRDERVMRDTTKAIEEDMSKLQAAARSGNKQATEEALKDLEKHAKRYLKAAGKRNQHIDQKGEDPLEELRRLWNKIGHPARELAKDPKGPEAPKHDSELNNIIQQARANLKKVNDRHNVDPVAAVQDVDESLDRLRDAITRGDPAAVSEAAKTLVNKANTLVPIAQEEKDPKKRNDLIDAVNELNQQIRKTLSDASAFLADPDNKQKRDQVHHNIDAAKVPVSKLQELLSPSNDRKLQQEIRDTMAKAGTLSDACVSGDSKDIAQAKQDLTNSLAKTIADAKAAAEKESDPVKRQRLNEQIKRLEELANKLANPNLSPEELKKISSEVIGALDDLLRTLNDDRKDTLDKSKGKAAAIAAKLREGANDMDLNALLQNALDLSKHLRGMMDEANALARTGNREGLSADARAALELDELLTNIEKSPDASADVSKLVDQVAKVTVSPPTVPKEEPKTFEEALDQAAAVIKQAVAQAQTDNESSTGVASELEKLAAAARAGQRQAMLIASRAVSAHLLQVIKEINDTIAQMGSKNPKEQDRLHRAAQALRNYGTQLKILTSVKAASIEKDNDADESLLSITRGLGNVLAEAIFTMDTVKITVLKLKR